MLCVCLFIYFGSSLLLLCLVAMPTWTHTESWHADKLCSSRFLLKRETKKPNDRRATIKGTLGKADAQQRAWKQAKFFPLFLSLKKVAFQSFSLRGQGALPNSLSGSFTVSKLCWIATKTSHCKNKKNKLDCFFCPFSIKNIIKAETILHLQVISQNDGN